MSSYAAAIVILICLMASSRRVEGTINPLYQVPDATGAQLQQRMIWLPPNVRPASSFVAFRKKVNLSMLPARGIVNLFADTRYMLWINGKYVLRGPARFDPKGPEYDTEAVTTYLKQGDNELVVLVMSNQSNGKMMHHAPGLTVSLQVTGTRGEQLSVETNSSWRWSDQTRYRNPNVDWGNEMDVIDSTVEQGDWTQLDFEDSGWKQAESIDGRAWGPLSARRIPLLKATPLEPKFEGKVLPLTLSAGQSLRFEMGRLVLAYTQMDCDADADTQFELGYAGITYKARPGRQRYISSDTHGFAGGSIKVLSGRLTLYSFQPVELLYPFECTGSFECDDPKLNKLWRLCSRSLQVMSEDSYIDCVDRERTEWMDDTPPCFDITQTAMTGPDDQGKPMFGDPRLLQELLRRTALSLQPEGWVKAHTCSDRFDIHARMEDRACDWAEGARLYYQATGDTTAIREIWPAILTQMNYFLGRLSSRGLVIGREWVMWDNPMGYENGEGTGLNAFVCKALTDAAFLARAIGKNEDADHFDQAASHLSAAINSVLWDEKDGTYYSGYDTPQDQMPAGVKKGKIGLQPDWHLRAKPPTLADNRIAPTVFPALFALDQQVVPSDRLERVRDYLISQPDPHTRIMFYYYYWKQLYDMNRPELDRRVLTMMRQDWKDMTNEPWQTSWEDFHEGSKAHCYGMFPGFFLSAYVLGVRSEGLCSEKRIVIDPRLGDLASAQGVVMTPVGPTSVKWKKSDDHLDFEVTIPEGATATLRLPSCKQKAKLLLDGDAVASAVANDARYEIEIKEGHHSGRLNFPSGHTTFFAPR